MSEGAKMDLKVMKSVLEGYEYQVQWAKKDLETAVEAGADLTKVTINLKALEAAVHTVKDHISALIMDDVHNLMEEEHSYMLTYDFVEAIAEIRKKYCGY